MTIGNKPWCFDCFCNNNNKININEIFDDHIPDDTEAGWDRNRYRAVAGWLVFVGIAGIITQVIFAIFCGLYYDEAIISQFVIFGVVVSLIYVCLLTK